MVKFVRAAFALPGTETDYLGEAISSGCEGWTLLGLLIASGRGPSLRFRHHRLGVTAPGPPGR